MLSQRGRPDIGVVLGSFKGFKGIRNLGSGRDPQETDMLGYTRITQGFEDR